jgi:peptidoglycan/xylan/chitin deacetylase (PgdA/CDA1 family)
MNVSPEHFAEQLAVLRARTRIVSAAAMASRSQRVDLPASAAAITFDDGYADNLSAARPLLEEADAPATVFVTTGTPGQEFWWDRLQRVLLTPETLPAEFELELGGRSFRWKMTDLTVRRRRWTRIRVPVRGPRPAAMGLLHRLMPLLRSADLASQSAALARIEAWANAPAAQPLHRAMTGAEIAQLAEGGLISIGAHTVSHPVMSRLPDSAQLSEVRSSRDWLADVLGREVRGFAYPFGQAGEYTMSSVRAVRDAGCDWAYAAFPGFVGGNTPEYEIPRMWVEDWNGEEFARRLDAWLPRR